MTLLFLNLLLILNANVFGQKSSEYSLNEIHNRVLDHLRKEPTRHYYVAAKTNKSYLKNFNFKDPSGLDLDKEKIWHKPGWKAFLNAVDTSRITDYQLASAGKPWFISPKKPGCSLIFAPVIISRNADKALCIFNVFKDGSGSYMACYLELERNKWHIKQSQTFLYWD